MWVKKMHVFDVTQYILRKYDCKLTSAMLHMLVYQVYVWGLRVDGIEMAGATFVAGAKHPFCEEIRLSGRSLFTKAVDSGHVKKDMPRIVDEVLGCYGVMLESTLCGIFKNDISYVEAKEKGIPITKKMVMRGFW
jgi:hypothetical protein